MLDSPTEHPNLQIGTLCCGAVIRGNLQSALRSTAATACFVRKINAESFFREIL
jgi:hypothetical protein